MDKTRGKIVVITEASAAIGRAIARRFARDPGVKLALLAPCGCDGAPLESIKNETDTLGAKSWIFFVDASDSQSFEITAEQIENTLGAIDVWINNARASVFSPVKEMKPEEFKRTTDVTYLGYVYGTLASLKRMLPRNRGVIVQVASTLAYRSRPLLSASSAAKHAIVGFSKSLRCELLHDQSDVKVTMVHLPTSSTSQPEMAADAIYYAANHPRRQFYIGWSTRTWAWAEMLVGSLADHYLAKYDYTSRRPMDRRRLIVATALTAILLIWLLS